RPAGQQLLACPAALPQGGPGPARCRGGQAALAQAGEQRPARPEQAPAHQHPQQVQQPQIRPERTGGDEGAKEIHRAIDCLRHQVASAVQYGAAPALYQRDPPDATQLAETRVDTDFKIYPWLASAWKLSDDQKS